jgi:hypothetical protein
MEKPLSSDFTDGQFRAENIHVVPNVVEHQLPNCRVGQFSEPLLEQPSHAQCADNLFQRILGMYEPSLCLDEAFHADFFFSAAVVVHAFTCTTVLPIAIKKSLGIQEKSWSNHTKM